MSTGAIDGSEESVDEDETAGGGLSPEPLGKLLTSLVCRRTGTKYLLCCWYCRCGVGAASPSIKSGALSSARDAAHNVVGLRILYNYEAKGDTWVCRRENTAAVRGIFAAKKPDEPSGKK